MMKGRRFDREKRVIMIVKALEQLAAEGKKPEATAYTIGKAIGMNPGGNLYAILSEMVTTGRLTARDVVHRPHVEKTLYALPEGTYELPEKQQSTIVINGQVYEREG